MAEFKPSALVPGQIDYTDDDDDTLVMGPAVVDTGKATIFIGTKSEGYATVGVYVAMEDVPELFASLLRVVLETADQARTL